MKRFKSTLLVLLLFFCCSLLSGCFEFIENINLKSNGSGSIKATLNLSKSSTKVASLLKLKSINGIQIPSKEKIQKETEDMVQILKKTNGISQVQYNLDFKNYIATVSCNFTSIKTLNAFTQALGTHFKSTMGNNNSYDYNAKTGVFTRSYKHSPSMSKAYEKIAEKDRKYFDEAYYTQIIRFDNTIKSQKHPSAKISNSSKSILLQLKAKDLANGKSSLGNTITLNVK
ncbi:hypothetical protein [Sphingobacterium bovistauri]|uniref:Lipoprotein n=1 Tax=Sphingobacterium bovistauri TaxID=2781959 RepID=A0ABS7Z1Y6_9SPHI|nr:hypothetical protein [Sphingobacterium bovistauri]MCA5004189.1 hypothetical protein [Sphingobacterium bovistauri]